MSRQSHRHYTLDEYFAVEAMSKIRHEFHDGDIFAMAGASLAHNEIAANVLTDFRAKLSNSECGAYGSDLRVSTPSGLYTYPDVSVICRKVELLPGRPDTATNPALLAEVLSDSTEEYDRGDKFLLYKSLPSLRHYLLISQTERLVEHWRRDERDEWQRYLFQQMNDVVELPGLNLSVALSTVYRRVF